MPQGGNRRSLESAQFAHDPRVLKTQIEPGHEASGHNTKGGRTRYAGGISETTREQMKRSAVLSPIRGLLLADEVPLAILTKLNLQNRSIEGLTEQELFDIKQELDKYNKPLARLARWLRMEDDRQRS